MVWVVLAAKLMVPAWLSMVPVLVIAMPLKLRVPVPVLVMVPVAVLLRRVGLIRSTRT